MSALHAGRAADQLAHPLADRLLRSSARNSSDPDVDLDWDGPLVDGLWYMSPERMSLFETPLWDGLSEDRRIELSKHEVASIASVGLWFELILVQLLVRDLYDDDPRAQRMHYALTEIADECRHSTMFGKAIARCGVPAYEPRPEIHRLGRAFKAMATGPSAFGSILVAEETLDRWQREQQADERVQPLIWMVSRIHVLEEARHLTFAGEEVQRAMPRLSRRALLWHQIVTAQTSLMVARALVNPDIYRAVGIEPREGRRQALANPHYRATLAWMGERSVTFLREQGLVAGHQDKVWRASMLMAERPGVRARPCR
ncbi:MAG: diiron oxygenase [Actinomycetota bacterium]|nr:diiron oxygenase [Actinomycetota bacterium]